MNVMQPPIQQFMNYIFYPKRETKLNHEINSLYSISISWINSLQTKSIRITIELTYNLSLNGPTIYH